MTSTDNRPPRWVDEALPATVRAKAEAAGAHDWLRRLPELVADIEADWAIRVGRVYTDATEAFVADATMTDGTPAVLKLIVPRAGNAAANEVTVLRLADGDGCARLLRHDVARDALLLEKLGPSLFELGLPVTTRHEILCDVASRVWRPAPDAGLPTGAAKGAWLTTFHHRGVGAAGPALRRTHRRARTRLRRASRRRPRRRTGCPRPRRRPRVEHAARPRRLPPRRP
ncbi:aminoglycoside phosphotransferase family protein [Dactylosporangium sp. NPDC050588]|uniref:aminoglycoside phosphotransferase family protein n=1 Tax=Dactylosporangium sp. NPDC050588 TaxID=3157211 RepID=UPI0033E4FEBE